MKSKKKFIFKHQVQYGDYVCYTTGGYYEAKKLLKEQIKLLIPEGYQKDIVWIKQLNRSFMDKNDKSWELSNNAAKKRGWYTLAWKTIPRCEKCNKVEIKYMEES